MTNLDNGLEELAQRAGRLLTKLRRRTNARVPPFYVEFAGTPKSGKSSCIDIVGHFFRRVGFKVHAPTEGASKRTPYYLKENLVAYNAWCASYALAHILEGVYGSDRFELAILDRGLFDSLAWFDLLSSRGEVSETDRRVIASFLMVAHWQRYIKNVFLFKADQETSLKREYENKLIDGPGLTMNPEFLSQLNDAYETMQVSSAKYLGDRLVVIDTSEELGTTPKSTAQGVALHIVEFMEETIGEKVE